MEGVEEGEEEVLGLPRPCRSVKSAPRARYTVKCRLNMLKKV